jgi:O-methyltransferase
VLKRTGLSARYIELLKQSLTNVLYVENEARYRLAMRAAIRNMIITPRDLYDLTLHQGLINALLDCKESGKLWLPIDPATGSLAHVMRNFLELSHSMIGRKRLDNIQYCVETVLHDRIAGDFIETGIWRGGAIILMRDILAAHGITDRIVWAADSFTGVPAPSLPEDEGFDISQANYPFLSVSLDQVKTLIARYDLLDDQVRFLNGWFKDTLPAAPIEHLSVLRLDGDLYESTMDGLNPLYHKVSPGGFIIVDDYFSCPPCRLAIDTFRSVHNITDPWVQIDGQSMFWRKSA